MLNVLILFLLPVIGSLIALILPEMAGKTFKRVVFILTLFPLAYLLYGRTEWIGQEIHYPWLSSLAISFHLSVDPLSLLFLYLTAVIVPISILSMRSDLSSPHLFYGLVLFLQALLIGFFTAKDLVVFTVFWEAMLLPLYFIISIWGGNNRQAAAFKFLIYMIAGSTLMMLAVLALYFASSSFNMETLAQNGSHAPYAPWLLAIFLLAFAVKTPLFPFHAWLPDAYYQAPTSGSILLAALLSKAGVYGILRIALGFFPSIFYSFSPFLLALAIFGVLYGASCAWMQNDFKRLIAYSSFSHVNFVLAGLFAWHAPAQAGAILQAINHGITITALFLVAGWLAKRVQSTSIGVASGLAQFMPHLCWLTLIFVLSAVALPGTNNFVGEFLILFGLFEQNPYLAVILGFSVILSVLYMLRWMQKMYFEAPSHFQESWVDIGWKHFFISFPLIFLIFWIGIYPAPILSLIKQVRELR